MNNAKTEAANEIRKTVNWLREHADKCDAQIDMIKGSIRSHNMVIAMVQNDGQPGFLKKVDNGYNFSGYSYNTPRYQREDAAKIVAELNAKEDREHVKFVALFDRDAMIAEAKHLRESADWSEQLIEGAL